MIFFNLEYFLFFLYFYKKYYCLGEKCLKVNNLNNAKFELNIYERKSRMDSGILKLIFNNNINDTFLIAGQSKIDINIVRSICYSLNYDNLVAYGFKCPPPTSS